MRFKNLVIIFSLFLISCVNILKSQNFSNLTSYEFSYFPAYKEMWKKNEENRNREFDRVYFPSGESYLFGSTLLGCNKIGRIEVYDFSNKLYGKIKESSNEPLDKLIKYGKIYFRGGSCIKYPKIFRRIDDNFNNPKYYLSEKEFSQINIDTCIKSLPFINKKHEVQIDNRIYTFNRIEGFYETYNKNYDEYDYDENLNLIFAQILSAAHDNLKYIYLTNEKKSVVIPFVNVSDGLDNKIINYDYGVKDRMISQNFQLSSVDFLSKTRYLIKFDVEGYYRRYMPNEIHGLQMDVTKNSLMSVVFDNNLNPIVSKEILTGDITLFDNKNKFYEIFKDGAGVICYNENLGIKWSNQYGITDKKTGDIIEYAKLIGNSLFLLGTTKNKYHYGIEDPCLWEIDITNGKLIKQEVIKMSNSPSKITGFFLTSNKLYLIIDYHVIVSGSEISNTMEGANNQPSKKLTNQNISFLGIGSQIWHWSNLDVDYFSNGDRIPEAKSASEWVNACVNQEPAWCYYANDTTLGKKYGRLYNIYALTDKRRIDIGFSKLPTSEDFKKLDKNLDLRKSFLLGGYRDQYGRFMSFSSTGYYWAFPNQSEAPSCLYFNTYSNKFEQSASDNCAGYYIKLIKVR